MIWATLPAKTFFLEIFCIFFWALGSLILTSFLSLTTNKKPERSTVAQNGHVVCHSCFFPFFSYYEPMKIDQKNSEKISKKKVLAGSVAQITPICDLTPYISPHIITQMLRKGCHSMRNWQRNHLNTFWWFLDCWSLQYLQMGSIWAGVGKRGQTWVRPVIGFV